jgi:hypothetical protein
MSNENKRPWYKSPTVIAAIVGAIGTIIAAYIGIMPSMDHELAPSLPATPTPTITQAPSVIPSPLPLTVQGIVTDENNRVVADVKVSIDGQSSMTGNDGRYVISDVPTGIKTIRVEQRGEVIFKSTIKIEGGKEIKTFDILLPSPTITETPEPTPSPISTETPIPTTTPKPTDGIDQLPPIDWGVMWTYFDISEVTLGKAEYTDVLGMVYVYD